MTTWIVAIVAFIAGFGFVLAWSMVKVSAQADRDAADMRQQQDETRRKDTT